MHASLWPLLQQTAAPAAPAAKAGAPVWWWPVEIGLIIAIFYFVMIRPQRRQADAQKQLLASVQKGDQVVTASGIVGEVIYLKDDQVTIRTTVTRPPRRSSASGSSSLERPNHLPGQQRDQPPRGCSHPRVATRGAGGHRRCAATW
jgi:preprotein translocase YajC subunit